MNPQILLPTSKLYAPQNQRNGWSSVYGSRRGRLEIVSEILLSCRKEQGKTKIMYANNLSCNQTDFYLHMLTTRKLLSSENGKFAITGKGYTFIEGFLRLNDLLFNEDDL